MQLTATIVLTLQGCPLSVLTLLALMGQPMSAEWLERYSGYSDKVVHKALLLLEENQFITRNGRYAWQIAAGVLQLPFMIPMLDSEMPEPSSSPSSEEDQKGKPTDEPQEAQTKPRTRRNSESEIPSPLASSRSTKLDLKQENLPPASNADPDILGAPEGVNFRVAKNLVELDTQGIHEPARSKLAHLAHVTPELIRAHCGNCKNLGQAIYRIEHNWAMPKTDIPLVPVSVITGFQQPDPFSEKSECIIDDQAENWWLLITDRLREDVPKVIFDNYFPVDSPVRQAGQVLEVLVANHSFEEHINAGDLDRRAEEISAGKVKSVRFVIQWEQPC